MFFITSVLKSNVMYTLVKICDTCAHTFDNTMSNSSIGKSDVFIIVIANKLNSVSYNLFNFKFILDRYLVIFVRYLN